MKRIVFIDYIRIFACFLVMIVHASECYYVSSEATMDHPIAYLENESDRFWVSFYDSVSRMAVPLFMVVSAYLLVPMDNNKTLWQFYCKRFKRILPPFFFFMILYSTLPLMWGQLDCNTSLNNLSRILLNFPTLAGHLWFIYPLISLYLFVPIISPWLEKTTAKEEMFFIIFFYSQYVCHIWNLYLVIYGGNVHGLTFICYGTFQDI